MIAEASLHVINGLVRPLQPCKNARWMDGSRKRHRWYITCSSSKTAFSVPDASLHACYANRVSGGGILASWAAVRSSSSTRRQEQCSATRALLLTVLLPSSVYLCVAQLSDFGACLKHICATLHHRLRKDDLHKYQPDATRNRTMTLLY